MVRQCDWPIIQSNRKRIKAGMLKYIEQYRRAKKNARNPAYKNLTRYSTLQYCEDELGLNSKNQSRFRCRNVPDASAIVQLIFRQ